METNKPFYSQNDRTQTLLKETRATRNSLGIYVHIPFCVERCVYCDFITVPYKVTWRNFYMTSLFEELQRWSTWVKPREVTSVYFGGGTPSLLSPAFIGNFLDQVQTRWLMSPDSEITLEVTPRSVNHRRLLDFIRTGVNRVSLGVQSLNKDELIFAGRKHMPYHAEYTADLLGSLGINWNADFILGLPGQTATTWDKNIRFIQSYRPNHVSVYFLEIHEGTPLSRWVKVNSICLPPESQTISLFFCIHRALVDLGYRHYELVNFARRGDESQHNWRYWKVKDYLGMGMAAHGCIGKLRTANPSNWLQYRQYLNQFPRGLKVEYRTPREILREKILLGLRTRKGIPRKWLEAYYGNTMDMDKLLAEWGWAGIRWGAKRIRLTLGGALRLHTLAGPLGLLVDGGNIVQELSQ